MSENTQLDGESKHPTANTKMSAQLRLALSTMLAPVAFLLMAGCYLVFTPISWVPNGILQVLEFAYSCFGGPLVLVVLYVLGLTIVKNRSLQERRIVTVIFFAVCVPGLIVAYLVTAAAIVAGM